MNVFVGQQATLVLLWPIMTQLTHLQTINLSQKGGFCWLNLGSVSHRVRGQNDALTLIPVTASKETRKFLKMTR